MVALLLTTTSGGVLRHSFYRYLRNPTVYHLLFQILEEVAHGIIC